MIRGGADDDDDGDDDKDIWGVCPDWYRVVRAARYLGVAPWDLLEQSEAWRSWAAIAEQAEILAHNYRVEEAERRRGR